MTSDTEARAEEELTEPESGDLSVDLPNSDAVASRYFKVALVFLALGLVDLLVLAVKRVAPDFLNGALLSYGRVQPAATTLLLFGWLTIGLIAGLMYVVPRVTNRDLDEQPRLNGALALLAVAYLGGAVAILLGFTEGRRYLEPLLIFDLLSLVAFVIVAGALIRIAKDSHSSSPVVWYSVAAMVWLILTHLVGNIPGLQGFNSQLQASFHRSSLIGLWFASAAIAVVYYGMPKLAGRPPLVGTRLSVLGIWSLGLTWAMTGPAELTFSAAGDWLETIGVIFSIVLFLPLVVIATDLTHGMRGAWENVRDRASLRYLLAGLAMFGVYALLNVVQALRASAAVVGFTDWVAAIEILVLLGPFTFILIGLLRIGAPDLFESQPSSGIGPYRLTLAGLTLTIGAMAVAGLQAGFTWAGAANSAAYTNFGDGWISTAQPLSGNYVVQLIGVAITAAGILWSVRAARSGTESVAAESTPAAEPEADLVLDEVPTVRKVRRYAYGFFALAGLMVFLLPSLETETPTILADDIRSYESGSLAAEGRAVYIQEGCMYCHTQQVRPIVTDVGLGPVSVLGDYAREVPVLIGVQRYGPDLMHFHERGDAGGLRDHLQDPRDARPWSIMPSYSHLSTDDMAALSAYLLGE